MRRIVHSEPSGSIGRLAGRRRRQRARRRGPRGKSAQRAGPAQAEMVSSQPPGRMETLRAEKKQFFGILILWVQLTGIPAAARIGIVPHTPAAVTCSGQRRGRPPRQERGAGNAERAVPGRRGITAALRLTNPSARRMGLWAPGAEGGALRRTHHPGRKGITAALQLLYHISGREMKRKCEQCETGARRQIIS